MKVCSSPCPSRQRACLCSDVPARALFVFILRNDGGGVSNVDLFCTVVI